jgi:bla regulator protein blaR1
VNPAYLSSLANHLWQSTLFAAIAGLLTLLLRKNRARVRNWVWLAASWKFLIPFSVLTSLGGHVHWQSAPQTMRSTLSGVMDRVSQPFTVPAASLQTMSPVLPTDSPIPALLWTIWACGFFGISCSWWIRWRRIGAVVRAGSPVSLGIPIRAVSSPALLEPGVFGVFRPVMLVPEGILDRLTAAQLKGVIAHELCHVYHRDNLMAAIHMFVETVFWCHPLVWWIGKRMVEERERACDEEVLLLGSEPRDYAEGILNVCKLYVESPLACAAGVTGANLKRRIEAIMANRIGHRLNLARKATLAAIGLAAIGGPIVIGMLYAAPSRAQSQLTGAPQQSFEVASVKPAQPTGPGRGGRGGGVRTDPGMFAARNASLKGLIVEAYQMQAYQILEGPNWLDSDTYDIEARADHSSGPERIRLMLQALLKERFKLTFHRDTKVLPIYALVVAKGGPKFHALKDGEDASVDARRNHLSFKDMPSLAGILSTFSDRAVVDQTGLKGDYYLNLDMSRALQSMEPVGGPGAAVISAVEDQFGLKVVPTKGPIEVIVIDHAEKPSQN